jgi:putative restriction endonuclease
VQVDEAGMSSYPQMEKPSYSGIGEYENNSRRSYITANVRQRVHQSAFRERVLRAYREQCAMCKLRHSELLDAAHIIPDGEPDGDPIVPNGLSLCKLHHAAFDRGFLGIRPDYVVEVRQDILHENDGPMLLHGLKEMHEKRIFLPRNASQRPSESLLERRYSRFLDAN